MSKPTTAETDLRSLRARLKSGEYDGADIMKAWLCLDRLEEQTAFIDAYLGQPDQTRVWDTIRGWEQRIKELEADLLTGDKLLRKAEATIQQVRELPTECSTPEWTGDPKDRQPCTRCVPCRLEALIGDKQP